jgi:hypothetical protein
MNNTPCSSRRTLPKVQHPSQEGYCLVNLKVIIARKSEIYAQLSLSTQKQFVYTKKVKKNGEE